MKKLIFLTLSLFCLTTMLQAQTLSVVAVKKNGVTIDTTTFLLNADLVQNIQNASPIVVSYADKLASKNVITYTLSGNESYATIYANANLYAPKLVNLLVSKINAAGRDTLLQFLYPISKINEAKSVTVSGQTSAKSLAVVNQTYGSRSLYLGTTPTELKTTIDSIYALSAKSSGYRYDTSTLTVKSIDEHIILNSTTADTITLLNPNLYEDRGPLVIANIGSGAYTIAGGFTVKDKSGSNVTSLTANTVYTFKSYYNGSAYIWLKEY